MRTLFTSESVTEGHPDKICDQISDAVLDAILEKDPMARVACECAATTGMILVMGEITTSAYVSIDKIARQKVIDIGYDRAKYGFDGNSCAVLVSVDEQSSDIAMGVDNALEGRAENQFDTGAGDQGMMFGYACDETTEYMPLAIALAHRLTRRLAQVRKSGELPYLRPDGKAQVTVEYQDGRPLRVHTVVVSAQHAPDVDYPQLQQDIIQHVVRQAIPGKWLDGQTRYLINPTGRFVIGGPHRGYLRRLRPSWWRRFLGEGSHQSGPLRRLRRPPCGHEPGGRRDGQPLRGGPGLRHRRGTAGVPHGEQFRYRRAGRRKAGEACGGSVRSAACRHH